MATVRPTPRVAPMRARRRAAARCGRRPPAHAEGEPMAGPARRVAHALPAVLRRAGAVARRGWLCAAPERTLLRAVRAHDAPVSAGGTDDSRLARRAGRRRASRALRGALVPLHADAARVARAHDRPFHRGDCLCRRRGSLVVPDVARRRSGGRAARAGRLPACTGRIGHRGAGYARARRRCAGCDSGSTRACATSAICGRRAAARRCSCRLPGTARHAVSDRRAGAGVAAGRRQRDAWAQRIDAQEPAVEASDCAAFVRFLARASALGTNL